MPSEAGQQETSSPPETGLAELPEDLLLKVFGYLRHASLSHMAQVSKSYRQVAASDSLWKDLHTRKFTHPPVRPSAPLPTWRDAYRWNYQVDRNWQGGTRRVVGIREHNSWVAAVKLASESGPVVSGGPDNDACVWSLDGELLHELPAHNGNVQALWTSLTQVASGGRNGSVAVWELEGGEKLHEVMAPLHAPVRSVQLLPEEHAVLAATQSGKVQVWDCRSGELSQHLGFGTSQGPSPLEQHFPCEWAQAEGHLVFGLGQAAELVCLDRRREGPLGRLMVGARTSCADMCFPRVVLGYEDGTVKVWDVSEFAAFLEAPSAPGASPQSRTLSDIERGARALRAVAQPHSRPVLAVKATEDWRVISSAEDGNVCISSPHPPVRRGEVSSPLKSFAPSLHLLDRLSPATDTPPTFSNTFGNGMLRPSAMLCLDATQSLLAVGGRDALVRLYSHEQGAVHMGSQATG